jgi:hypothetical protein
MTLGLQRPDTKAEVILGVDTHLDFHTAVDVNYLGRRLDPEEVRTAARFALRSVARSYETLSREIAQLDAQLDQLVAQVAPELVSLAGIGTDHAATLLIVALKTIPRG